jgi:hypothetical protein
MITLAIVCLAIAAYVASMNIWGCLAAIRRRRANPSAGGYSAAPLVSLIFGALAYLAGRDPLWLLALVPAVFDPGNWAVVYLPFFLWRKR